MTNKRLELVNEFSVHVSPTVKGVGITIMGQETDPSFHEFAWHNLIEDLIEEHTVTVLKTSDVRVTKDSKEALLKRFDNLTWLMSKNQVEHLEVPYS
jgi:hypothetical protein